MPRQLNVRSDEAHALAHRIAARRGTTASRVVVDALRAYAERETSVQEASCGEATKPAPTPENRLAGQRSARVTDASIAASRAKLDAILNDMWSGPPLGSSSPTEDDMYDENGLPR